MWYIECSLESRCKENKKTLVSMPGHMRTKYTWYTSQMYTSQMYTSQMYTSQMYTSQMYTSQMCTSQMYTSQMYTSQMYTSQRGRSTEGQKHRGAEAPRGRSTEGQKHRGAEAPRGRSTEVRYSVSKYPYYRIQMGSPWLATGSYFGKMKPQAPGRFLNTSRASRMP